MLWKYGYGSLARKNFFDEYKFYLKTGMFKTRGSKYLILIFWTFDMISAWYCKVMVQNTKSRSYDFLTRGR